MNEPVDNAVPQGRRRINWVSISTVTSAAILIGAEVFGAAYAGGWALTGLLGLDYYLGDYATYAMQALFCALGLYVMALFIREARRVEPFVTRD
jgi:hypothetical protein